MPMPLVIPLPAHVEAIYAKNVDSDAATELIVELSTAAGSAPDRVSLLVLHFAAGGQLERQERYELGHRALAWDAAGALYGMDKEGLLRLRPGAEPERLVKTSTPLVGLGPTRPIFSPFAHDLDGDGIAELLLYAGGRISAFTADGREFGHLDAAAEGELSSRGRAGGQSLDVRVRAPSYAVGDLDGDGVRDLVIPAGATATLAYSGPGLGARVRVAKLPLDLEPPEAPPSDGEERREIAEIWFRDFDGDGRLDLGLYRWVTTGSFFGATAEVLLCRGDGSGFGPPVAFATEVAAFGLEPVDIDGDGDLDLVGPLVDVGLGNVARALVTQEVKIDLSAFKMENGRWASVPVTLRQLPFVLSAPARLQSWFRADVNGDGRLDLVTNDAQDLVRVYAGTATGVAGTPLWEQAVKVPSGEGTLLAADLDGDKKAEVVVWGPDQRQLTVLRSP